MRNGEKLSPAITSPAPPEEDRGSDGEDELSHYSSCGDSEFERYCSATSVMGTPSTSFHDSDFGSVKSFKLGGSRDEAAKIRNSGVKSLFSSPDWQKSSNNGVLNLHGRMSSDFDSIGNLGGSVDFGDFEGNMRNSVDFGKDHNKGFLNLHRMSIDFDSMGNLENEGLEFGDYEGNFGSSHEGLGESVSLKNYEGRMRNSSEGLAESANVLNYEGEVVNSGGAKERGHGSRVEEGECSGASSRYEHSEGEDSMFGCGSDDERQRNIGMYYGKNELVCGDMKEDLLVMNSSVAFGSDDWADFEQETRENTLFGAMQQSMNNENGPALLNELGTVNVMHDRGERDSELAQRKLESSTIDSAGHGKLDEQEGGLVSSKQVINADELADCSEPVLNPSLFETNEDPLSKQVHVYECFGRRGCEVETRDQNTSASEVMGTSDGVLLEKVEFEKRDLELDPLCGSVADQSNVNGKDSKEDEKIELLEDRCSIALSAMLDKNIEPMKESSEFSFQRYEDHFGTVEKTDLELNDLYGDIVNDMEDILLDSAESPRSRLSQKSRLHPSRLTWPSRDGGSTASTSGTEDADSTSHQPLRIDSIEVVGARRKKGDASLSERLVGVKEYTVYKIRVWSGNQNWEVERRYRDFSILHRRLKKLFVDQGWVLPSPWSSVEKESKKIFVSASPDVIAERSSLIQECLRSVIHPRVFSFSLNALIHFLSPEESVLGSRASDASSPQSLFGSRGANISTLGKTISLVVEVRPYKSMKQMLDAQHYSCAACHKNFDDGLTRVREFVQALGWGKPRLCEYSGQLFCPSCHNNDTAILPARVLHFWDFTLYPVSQLAKSYLESIHDQPMLCVSAVNPYLFSKVAALQHAANIRNRIRAMLPYVRCSFRSSIYRNLGARKYLLESNDFFSLKDLIDLSKGVFSVLPVMLETVSRKIQEHIVERCLVCYDVGVPCSARLACNNPLALIFPFQEGEVEKCSSCESVFHKNCFKQVDTCPCGARLNPEHPKQNIAEGISRVYSAGGSNPDVLGGKADPTLGLLSRLFTLVTPQSRSLGLREQGPKDTDNVILMGSLPSTSL